MLPYLEKSALKHIGNTELPDTDFARMVSRVIYGKVQYGPVYPGKRDWAKELREELYDAMIYAAYAKDDPTTPPDLHEKIDDLLDGVAAILRYVPATVQE